MVDLSKVRDSNQPIVIEAKIRIDASPHGIPRGTYLDVRIVIVDEYETIRTSNYKFTKDLAKVAPLGSTAKYSERLQKTIINYPGKTKQEIAEIVKEDLKTIPTK
jgi:hypothetical protein